MTRQITGKSVNFNPVRPRSNPYRVLLWAILALAGVWILLRLQRGEVQSPFMPTATPTRMSESYILEAEAYFDAGKLDDPASDQDAIGAYQRALAVDTKNANAWAELARIQAYSSSLLSTDQERLARLQEALESINKAWELDPENSTINAIRAFIYDWNASSNLITVSEREAYLLEAEGAANRAYLLDPDNSLALAFYAEVLLDQQKWDQALEYSTQAVNRSPDSMDAHRVYATVLESVGNYRDSINEYKIAAEITPNLTFLYLRVGYGYRHLQQWNIALDYFDKAASINQTLGIKDPMPYIAIAKTYAQQGEFFVASRNAEKALSFNPASADTYGQLGMIYVQARNYEAALPALRCAVDGCSAEENETAVLFADQGILEQSYPVQPLELTNLTVAYYYVRYGSVLAYLSSPQNGYCERSLELMAELRATFPDDPVLLENVEDNEATCAMLSGSSAP
jgi:tetratricopeptide (TPR) repeat protein